MPLDAKSFDLGWPLVLENWKSKPPNREASQIEAFTIHGHGPRMLKASNSKFLDPKTSNSKLLPSRGWPQDVKSFDLGWPPGLEV